jgi:hypothetical protein
MPTLVLLCGQEGAGKSTLAKGVTPYLKNGAAFDAENILQVNPFNFNDAFRALAIKNSISLIQNFFEAGFETVVAGSFIGNRDGYDAFRKLLQVDPKIYIVMLNASKVVRDERRITREKPTTREWRDDLDRRFPPDRSLYDSKSSGDYEYIEIDNSELTLAETLKQVCLQIPGVFTEPQS